MRFTNGVSATEYPCFLGEKQNFVLSVLKIQPCETEDSLSTEKKEVPTDGPEHKCVFKKNSRP